MNFHQLKASVTKIPLLLPMILYLLISGVMFYLHDFPFTHIETDSFFYMERATGPLFQISEFHGPAYSLAIRLVSWTDLNLFPSAKLISLISGAGFLWASERLMKLTKQPDDELGWFPLLLIVANAEFLLFSIITLSDMMSAALALWVIIGFMRSRIKFSQFVWLGALAGLAYLTRYIYSVLLVMPFIWLLISEKRKHIFKNLGLFYGAFLLVAIPWFIYLYRETGNPFYNLNYLNIAFNMYSGGKDWIEFPTSTDYSGVMDLMMADPYLFFRTWIINFGKLPVKILQLSPMIGYVGFIAFFHWVSHLNKKKVMYMTILLVYGVVVSLVWSEPRFFLLFLPLVALMLYEVVFHLPENPVFEGLDKQGLSKPHP